MLRGTTHTWAPSSTPSPSPRATIPLPAPRPATSRPGTTANIPTLRMAASRPAASSMHSYFRRMRCRWVSTARFTMRLGHQTLLTIMARRGVVLGIRFRGRTATLWVSRHETGLGVLDGWRGKGMRFREDSGEGKWNGGWHRVRAVGTEGHTQD